MKQEASSLGKDNLLTSTDQFLHSTTRTTEKMASEYASTSTI